MSNLTNTNNDKIKSVTRDTKSKFDALLKASLLRKQETVSKENLIEPDIQSISSFSETPAEIPVGYTNEVCVDVDIHENNDDKTYIINKFLTDSRQSLNNTDEIRAPVPKPRLSRTNLDNASSCSRETFNLKKSGSSSRSNDTFNIDSNKNPIDERKSSLNSDNLIELSPTFKSSDKNIVVIEDETKPKPRKRISKLKSKNSAEIVETTLTRYSYENIISITVIKADYLELESYVIHPVVKIHLVDCNTGNYLKKSDSERPVLFYYENKDIDYIGPIMTEPYNLQQNRSLNPQWNETIIINEDFNYFIDNKDALLFFEVIDFLTSTNIQLQKGTKKPWRKIAWAFLKHTGTNGRLNVNRKVRLQLYRPLNSGKKYTSGDHCDIYNWWRNSKLTAYPSSLHIQLQQLKQSNNSVACNQKRSKTPLERDTGNSLIRFPLDEGKVSEALPMGENQDLDRQGEGDFSGDLKLEQAKVTWMRNSYESCKIPNNLWAKLNVVNNDSCVLKFSNNGQYLAYSVVVEKVYTVVVYSVITFEEICHFPSHQDIIYSINWFNNDRFLMTTSADWTVCIWDVTKKSYLQMLPHPSFVYCSDYSATKQIATGCYDNTIRIWLLSDNNNYELFQELESHRGYVTCLKFNKNGDLLISGDSQGVFIVWKCKETQWMLKKDYNILELKSSVINEILFHPKEKRVFVYSRDNFVRLIDLKNGYVMHRYHSGKIKRINKFCTLSPCQTYLFIPGDHGDINIWNIDNNQLTAIYKPSNNANTTINCINFHPIDNIIAISEVSNNSCDILLYKYEFEPKNPVNIEYFYKDADRIVQKVDTKLSAVTNVNKKKINQDELETNESGDYKASLKDIIAKMDKIIDYN